MPLHDALDFANYLVARLNAIRQLKLDYTNVTPLNQPTIIDDPGGVNEFENKWRRYRAPRNRNKTN